MTSRRCFLCAEKGSTTMHMFPKDPSSHSLWKQICDLQEFDDVSRLFLCSNHFKLDDYREPSAQKFGGKLRLKPGAFPSVSVPNKIHMLEHTATTSSMPILPITAKNYGNESEAVNLEQPLPVSTAESSPMCNYKRKSDDQLMCTPKKRHFYEARYFSEVTISDFDTPRRAKRAFHLAKEEVKRQRLRNRALQQKNRRLKIKITSLQELLTHLQQKNVLSEGAGDTLLVILLVVIIQNFLKFSF
ncbi:hypothetical protein RI129_001819 [Pyrocoelia pectoralis]|uniref:THAP-type domain-containing protein n=1 Tax=Pyrocoelia pectoralis TaxID=417401 RepID=A0AAN7VP70_9COLE